MVSWTWSNLGPGGHETTTTTKDAPSSVTIKAQKEAKPGDVISATCKTERSNPASEITWVVDGIPLIGESTVETQESGGWITVSKINVNVTQQV
ncbi:hypothetical protein AVEN_172357-1 [Araneus ventricosus]|uniref:Ig-like domain-containing protein n=1 Tax=Araneus ventricosus TaxID=182803 RepID=A0A4Y2DRG4_ARAVE|nr:hypothetical protein AVEN_172357-1 [Araneus ventricosus]